VRLLLVALLLAGCKSDRERDCDVVRDTLKERAMPRRYYDYAPNANHEAGDTVIVEPLDRLKHMTWRDAEVRAAVEATTDTWTLYSPYSTDADPIAKLRALCAIETR
jgi:hypothetical protein